MKRKLISFVCALSMILSVVSGMTLINAGAADGPTVVGTAEYVPGTKTATVKIGYEGFPADTAIKMFQAAIEIDTDIFEMPVNDEEEGGVAGFVADDKMTTGTSLSNADGNHIYFLWMTTNKKEYVEGAEAPAYTLTLTVKDPSKLPATLKLSEVKMTDNTTSKTYGTEDLAPDTVIPITEPVVVDPSVTPSPTPVATVDPAETVPPEATLIPEETEGPDVTPTPEPTDARVKGTATYDASTGTATIEVAYAGFPADTAIKMFQAAIEIDTDIFEMPVNDEEEGGVAGFVADDKMTTGTSLSNADGNHVYFLWMTTNKKEYVEGAEAPAYTLTLKVKDPSKLPATLKLSEVKMTDNTTSKTYGTADLAPDTEIIIIDPVVSVPPAPATPTPVPTATPKPATHVELADVVSDAAKDAVDAAEDDMVVHPDKKVVVDVQILDKNGDPIDDLTYGEDFYATWGGQPLTETQYKNAMNGYNPFTKEKAPKSDFIENLGFTFNDTPKANNVGRVKATVKITNDEGTFGPGSQQYDDDKAPDPVKPDETPKPSDNPNPTTKPTDTPSNPDDGGSSTGGVGSHRGTGNKGSSSPYGGVIPGGVTGTTTSRFVDLGTVPWAVSQINSLATMGIIEGKDATHFDPDANVTRAEFATLVVKALGLTPTGRASFPDAADHWASAYINVAAQNGIVMGYSETEFAPEKTILRQEMAAMIVRAGAAVNRVFQEVEPAEAFTDEADIDDYAKNAVTVLQQANIINGMGDGTFAPKATATRAEAAVILFNYVTTK